MTVWRTLGALVLLVSAACGPTSDQRPNFVVILIDDLGYADVGVYGSERNRTPQIDRMAAEGLRFTDFYTTCPVCSPSR